MKSLSSRVLIAFGLSSIVVTALLLALFAGLVPDREGAQRAARTGLAESMAVSVTVLLGDEDGARLAQVLNFLVQRNPDLQSVGLRSADGIPRLISGPHPAAWDGPADGSSTDTHVRIPLLFQGASWGQAELVFVPLQTPGLLGWRGTVPVLVSSMGLLCFGLFYVYLGRTLRHLDPSRVIPGRVRTAFDTLAEGLIVLDPKGRIVLANRAFADVLKVEPEALIGREAGALGWSQPVQEGVGAFHWASMVANGEAHRNVLMYLNDGEGRRRSFMINGSPVPGAGGKAAGMLVSLDDVTALEEKEIQLRVARDAAETANRAKSDFLANMSHEIRTPMNAILGFAELLRRGWQTDGQQSQKHLDTILSSGRHLLALINDILDLSKVEAGRLEVERIPCAVHEVVNEVAAIMQVRAQERGIRLDVDYPEALPATVLTDPGRLRQVVTNLVGNAIKFTREGGVTVSVRLLDRGPPGRLGIDVRDSGIGIPTDKLEAIFEPFVQAEASTTRQFGGTGLGLAISRRFARALGGDVKASSVPGKGSTFHVTLEVGALDEGPWLQPQQLHEATQHGTQDTGMRWVFAGERVLVVDDGQENRELVRLVLESAGLSVIEAENGAIALERVAQDAPAVVLMDMQMPVMDGVTATRRLRENGFDLPILALTANAMKGFEKELDGAGFSGFLTKPVDIDALLAELARRLGARQEKVAPKAAEPAVVAAAAVPAPSAASAPAPAPTPALAAGALPAAPADPAMPEPVLTDEDLSPIVSRLANHPRLARVARSFCQTLPTKLQAMREALAERRLNELAELAHWLKGAGGTVGYDSFFEPAREFELHARAGRLAEAERALCQIESLAARIEPPPEAANASQPASAAVLDRV
ncbi:MAG: response regulator [Rubrivivax sp.]|nr:response regulator [Rubrivivax sp.]